MQLFAYGKLAFWAMKEQALSRNLIKTWRIMKLTALLFTAAFMHAAASGDAQKINLSVKNVPLAKVFVEIQKQSGYSFVYTEAQAKRFQLVTATVIDANIEQALEICLKDQPFSFEIINNTLVTLKPKNHTTLIQEVDPHTGTQVATPFIDVKGKVLNEKGDPVPGVTVTIKETQISVITNSVGEFSLQNISAEAVLIFTHVGMETFELKVSGKSELLVRLKTKISELGDVTITVSTGYQDIPKERATGSFAKVDNATLNQQTGTNILKRLEGVTSGLLFDNNKVRTGSGTPGNDNITIRGLSTINASMSPLVVLDGFIYEGDINNINPNDVENVSVLKDAAAASIWGARAGNGVIVITTKKGNFNQKLQVGFNSNVIVGEKPDLSYLPQMTSSDYIDVEEYLFNQGFYGFEDRIAMGYLSLTPAVQVLLNRRNGLISATDSASQINALKSIDVRDQFNKYLYRTPVTQQYSVNLRGGSENNAYAISAGYDNSMGVLQDRFEKLNVRVENTYRPFKKLLVNLGVYYTNSISISGAPAFGSIYPAGRQVPYFSIADNNGLPVPVTTNYNDEYIDAAGAGKLLNWKYYPLEDWKHNKTNTNLQEIFANMGLKYKVTNFLNLDIRYQYQRQHSLAEQLADLESFYARNLINSFTQIDFSTGSVTYIIPKGDIKTIGNNYLKSYTARAQFDLDKTWNDHSIVAILGGETRQIKADANGFTAYGYSDDPLVAASVDYRNTYPDFITGSNNGIPGTPNFNSTTYRFVSVYANSSYTYKKRYTLSGSARRDGSNIFGVKTNDRWKPLWSLGAAWKISDEFFYKFDPIPLLKLRATYGYSGNVDLSRSALPVGAYFSAPTTGFPATRIDVLNNPDLRWEKSAMFNVGLDFALKGNFVTGSIEYYSKKGIDLYGPTQYNYTVWGYLPEITINAANLKGHGIDFMLNAKIVDKQLKWYSNVIFNYNTNKVTKYNTTSATSITSKINAGQGIAPVIGKPIYAIAAYKWGGLDNNGNPQGYVNGQLSTAYNAIFSEGSLKGIDGNVVYIGPSSPPVYGSLNNMISWKRLSVSFLISYKFAYYFNKSAISYTSLIENGVGHKDFAGRWRKPGDEQFTSIPSFIYPNDQYRDNFYTSSEVNVLKADHIRLQFVNLSYTMERSNFLPFNDIQFYINAANLGIIWRANKENIDPEYPLSIPPTRNWTFGIRANF